MPYLFTFRHLYHNHHQISVSDGCTPQPRIKINTYPTFNVEQLITASASVSPRESGAVDVDVEVLTRQPKSFDKYQPTNPPTPDIQYRSMVVITVQQFTANGNRNLSEWTAVRLKLNHETLYSE